MVKPMLHGETDYLKEGRLLLSLFIFTSSDKGECNDLKKYSFWKKLFHCI